MTPEEAIEILWEYHHVKQELRPADLIFILGSNDVRVAEYAAELYARKRAPLLLFSGGMGRFTGEWAVPEAEKPNISENCWQKKTGRAGKS